MDKNTSLESYKRLEFDHSNKEKKHKPVFVFEMRRINVSGTLRYKLIILVRKADIVLTKIKQLVILVDFAYQTSV